jgi:hypothetical protein
MNLPSLTSVLGPLRPGDKMVDGVIPRQRVRPLCLSGPVKVLLAGRGFRELAAPAQPPTRFPDPSAAIHRNSGNGGRQVYPALGPAAHTHMLDRNGVPAGKGLLQPNLGGTLIRFILATPAPKAPRHTRLGAQRQSWVSTNPAL